MFIEILAGMLIGILFGTITGLTPGLHINLVSVLILQAYFAIELDPLLAVTTIISMAVTHTFVDCIPAMIFGVPDPSLALLPQHQLIHKGQGYEAIKFLVFGSMGCLLLSALMIPVIFGISYVINAVKIVFPFMLAALLVWSVLTERKKTIAFLVVVAAGSLGYLLLNSNINEPLFILFTGMFGLSSLFLSYFAERIPLQIISRRINLPRKYWGAMVGAVIASALTTVLPGVGAAHAAFLVQTFAEKSPTVYLIIVGGLNTVNAIVALVFLSLIGRARTGITVVLDQITKIPLASLVWFGILIIVAGCFATIITLTLGRIIIKRAKDWNMKYVSVAISTVIVVMGGILSGPLGLFALFICACLGIIVHVTKCRKSLLMSCLIVPLILYFI